MAAGKDTAGSRFTYSPAVAFGNLLVEALDLFFKRRRGIGSVGV